MPNEMTPTELIVSLISKNLTDYAERSKQWVYPFRPNIRDLMTDKTNFPLVSIEPRNITTQSQLGIGEPDLEERIMFIINVWCNRKYTHTIETWNEDIIYQTGTTTYPLTNYPCDIIESVTGWVGGNAYIFASSDFEIYDDDDDGYYESVRLIGTLPDDGTNISVTYAKKEAGAKLASRIAHDIHVVLKDNWMGELVPTLYDYKRESSNPLDFERELGIMRHSLHVSFNGVDIGE